jgi:predicted choloylglycine hydrolase
MKGEAIRFIAGKYAGKKGWIDLSGKEGDETTPVIVNLRKKGEKKTYVNDSSYEAEPTDLPSSYAEAVMQQCPDLQKLLVNTCRALVKADITKDPDGFYTLIAKMMGEAKVWQESKGSKALYRKIEYDETD